MKIEHIKCDICGKEYARAAGTESDIELKVKGKVYKDLCDDCSEIVYSLVDRKIRKVDKETKAKAADEDEENEKDKDNGFQLGSVIL
ncbi:MAG: hypothetical protein ACP5MB_06445 [bacterium]